jgi:hypothetical protein
MKNHRQRPSQIVSVLFAGSLYCRDCPDRKKTNLALLVNEGDSGYSDVDSDDGNTKHLAFVTHETALISKHALLLDSQSSANIVVNKHLLIDGSIRRTENGIVLNGVEKGSPGINVDLVGDLGDVGEVYYCPEASANILSFAAMLDSGADIRYDAKHGRFTMKPRGSDHLQLLSSR